MKKLVLLGALLVAGAAIFAQKMPAFDNPKAAVFDVSAIVGKAKNTIRIINATHEDELDIAVSVYDVKKQQWLTYGTGELRSISSAVTVAPAVKGSLKNYPYVAVVPSFDKPCKILCSAADNAVCFSVLSLEEPSEYATVLDVFSLKGTFKNAVSFVNKTAAGNSGFDIYAQKDESDTWFKVGTAYSNKAGDTCPVFVVTPDPVETYRYFSVIAHNGSEYSYEAKKEKNKLVLTVR